MNIEGNRMYIAYLDNPRLYGSGNAIQHLHYLPFGEDWVDQRNSSWNVPYTFSGKEKDVETGYGYFGARYYDSGLSIWLSVDPMSDKYPSMSPYNYCLNSPIIYFDPDGNSTHTDMDGNVIQVVEDGYLGIFKHTKEEVDDFTINQKDFINNQDQLVGFTLCTSSFKKGDKIDFGSFEAQKWMGIFESSFCLIKMSPLQNLAYYMINAKNGGIYDPKSYIENGSQISDGIYFSPRDLGNFAAGRFAAMAGIERSYAQKAFGAFHLGGNSIKNIASNMPKAENFPTSNSLFPNQRTYGETPITNYFIRLGYDNIRTLSGLNSNYSSFIK